MQQTHRGVEDVFRQGDVMIGYVARYPASFLGSPQDAVEVGEILEDVVTLFSPMAQFPVSHFRTLEKQKENDVRSQRC